MKTTNGTPATTETPREQYLSECLTERREVLDKTRAEYFKLEQKCAALTAKAAALDALLECCEVVAMHCVLDDDRFFHEADAKRFYAALSAAKAAQVKS